MPTRTLAIGDIHGCLAQFDALIAAISLTPEDHLILLGDYVDRGPESAGVLKRIIKLSRTHHVSAIKGNHEEMMLGARTSQDTFRDWILNGGDATLRSYAGVRATIRDVTPEHWEFLGTSLLDYVETDTHIFVHASVYPDHPMNEQPEYILRWQRCDDIGPHASGKVIVCGHTPQTSGRPMNRGYAICIDTHACRRGALTCLDATSGKVWQATADGDISRAHIADFSDD